MTLFQRRVKTVLELKAKILSSRLTAPLNLIEISSGAFVSRNILQQKQQKPTILLCGWMDAPLGPLGKYVKFYENLGFPILLLECKSMHMAFLPKSLVHNEAARIFDMVESNVLIAHVLSNGGLCSLFAFLDNSKSKVRSSIRGLIIDSAPTAPGDKKILDIIYFQRNRSFLPAIMLAKIFKIVYSVFFYIIMRFFPQFTFVTIQYNRLLQEFQNVPRLFLYGTHDKLIGPKNVEKAITDSRNMGHATESVVFTSPHVEHYRLYPEIYAETIKWFLKKYRIFSDTKSNM